MAYDRGAPHQLRQFHLLREYKRNIGIVGFSDAKALLDANDIEQARGACRADSGVDARQGAALARQGIAKETDASSDGRVEIPHNIVVGAVQP